MAWRTSDCPVIAWTELSAPPGKLWQLNFPILLWLGFVGVFKDTVERTRHVRPCPPDAPRFLWHSRQKCIHSQEPSSHNSSTVLCPKETARFWGIHSCAFFSVLERKWKWKSLKLKPMTKNCTRKEVCEKTLIINKTWSGCLGGRWAVEEGSDGSLFWGHAHCLTPQITHILQTWTRIFWLHLCFEIRFYFFPFIFSISKMIVVLQNFPLLVDCLWLFVHIWYVWVVSSFLL